MKVTVIFIALVTFTNVLAQETTTTNVPFRASFQSIATDHSSDSLILYMAFDGGNHGRIKKYHLNTQNELVEEKQFFLPIKFSHPNEIQIENDQLIVTGYDQSNISTIGVFDKHSGKLINVIRSNIDNGLGWLQSVYHYKDTLYQCLYDGNNLNIQKWVRNKFITVKKSLKPDYLNYQDQPIQGSKVYNNELYILSAFPTRIDIYDALTFDYKCSFFGEYNFQFDTPESEGIAIVRTLEDELVFYGLRPPNRINSLFLEDLKTECARYFVGEGNSQSDVILRAFSNPIDENTIKIKVLNDTQLNISLYDTKGTIIRQIQNGFVQKGNYEFEINIQNLNPTINFLVIRTSIGVQTVRIIL